MNKDMSMVYSLMPLDGLRTLRSKKYNRVQKLARDFSWFANKEKNTLNQQIKWIDAEIQCRADQMRLFE